MEPGGSLVWTEKYVALLLNSVIKYRVNKIQNNVDWELCGYIGALFVANTNILKYPLWSEFL